MLKLKIHASTICKQNLRNLILEGLYIYCPPFVALPSHFSWKAQLDARFSPTLKDEISEIPFRYIDSEGISCPKDARNWPLKAVMDTCPPGEMNRCLCHDDSTVTFPFRTGTLGIIVHWDASEGGGDNPFLAHCRPKRVTHTLAKLEFTL